MSPTDRFSDAPPFEAIASLSSGVAIRAVRRSRAQQEEKTWDDEAARRAVEGVRSQRRED